MRGTRRQQRGIVAVLVTVGLLALLAMVGLALETGHLVLNKSRLQSTVDAAALAAAKVLDQTGSRGAGDGGGPQRVRPERRQPAGTEPCAERRRRSRCSTRTR